MDKKTIYGIGALIVLIIASFFVFSDNSISNRISPISIIKYSDENASFFITKNNLDKTASINMELFVKEDEIKNDFMDMTEPMTTMFCGLMQMAFFNETALEEFNQAIQEWNEMDGVVENEEGEEVGTPEENPLEGYKVNKFNFYLKDEQTKNIISECKVTGPLEEDIIINYR